ncbi:DNA-3-methyladenine glycosylase family protein [Halobacillus mangrovi]|uniref:DNA-3-methyladenine glycosylase II n=1 Tax=Halobacillus mangrovi TaxID=402384 RepID=A0A1W5ZYL6_9BACI|nr:DNA-3-methyladenine glycosylase [Halobacillus mangrovi]ARI78360.1 DNA-3-methyladenine glycosylase [Halobacillus mangrovi]
MWRETYKANSFYDFDYTLLRWQFDPLSHLDRKERWVDVPVKLESEQHVVRVQGHGTISNPSFEVIGDSIESKPQLLHHIESLFQWDKDLVKVHEHFLETNLEQLFLAHPGTPIVKDFHLFDCLMKVIIHQQLNMKFAHTLSTRFVHQFGTQKNGVWFYPTASQVAEIPYESLRELQFSQRKAEYVVDTSRKIVDGELNLEDLAKQPDEEVMKQLTKIRGIGPWTAENWLMFGLGRDDLLPKADIGIQNALKFYFQLDNKPDMDQMTNWSQEWSPYRSYASLTLWRSIEG